MEYKYKIGDKVYYQKPLVLGQIKQLEVFLKDFIIPGDLNVTTLMAILGDKIPRALAIVLIEEGKSLSERFRLPEISNPKSEINKACFGYEPLSEIMNMIAMQIAVNIDLETTAQVVEDFFVCNPTASIFRRLAGIIGSLGIPQSAIHNPQPAQAGLMNSASSSPEGTSQNETAFCGDTPLPSASPILNTASVT